ncbi:hypothetical protein AVEN_272760-1, partial [Araneus ventricosus]
RNQQDNLKWSYLPTCLSVRSQLKNGRRDSFGTKVGILTAMAQPHPRKVRSVIEGGQFNTDHYCIHVQEREPSYLSGAFSSTYSWFPRWDEPTRYIYRCHEGNNTLVQERPHRCK